MPLAPTLSLALVYLIYWLVCRLYGWRATLGPGTFLMFFTFGTVGSVLVALYAEAIPFPFPLEEGTAYAQVNPTTWLIGPTIEEIAKILPLLAIVALVPAARRLGIADFVLIGFTVGLGFGFVEANFGRVLSADISSWGNILAFGYSIGTPQAQYLTYSTGHEVAPALVGLGLGIGVRFWPDRYWKWLPGAAMLAYGAFDHSMWNFKQQHQYPNSFDLGTPLVESLYRFTMHGFVAVVLLPMGIVVASFLEGRWSWRAAGSPDAYLLPDEHDSLFGEARLFFGRRRLGPGAMLRTLTYFRHRRAYALAAADAARTGADASFAELSRGRLLSERELVARPVPSAWIPTRKSSVRIAQTILRRYGMVLAVTLLLLLFFAVAPAYLPWLHSHTFAMIVVLASAAFTAWRIVRFLRGGKPEPRSSDGETLAKYRTRAIMLASSAVATAVPLLALGLNRRSLIPGAVAYITAYVGNWTQAGGSIEGLMASGGTAAAAGLPRKPPCEDLQQQADAGADRVKALELKLEKLIDGFSPGQSQPIPGAGPVGANPGLAPGASGGGKFGPAVEPGCALPQSPSNIGEPPPVAWINPKPIGSGPGPIDIKPPPLIGSGAPSQDNPSIAPGMSGGGKFGPAVEPGCALPQSPSNIGEQPPLGWINPRPIGSGPVPIDIKPPPPMPGQPAVAGPAGNPFGVPKSSKRPLGWTDTLPLPEPMKLPPGVTNLEDVQKAEADLEAERAAQEKRMAALNLCLSQAATRDKPANTPDSLQKAFDDAKNAYDQAQADLNKAMKDGAKSLADFNKAYNDNWNKAIGKLDDYMRDHAALAKPLADLWKDRAMNERVKQFAQGVDMLSGAAQLGNGLLKKSLAAEAKALAPELEGGGNALAANASKLEQDAAAAESAANREVASTETPTAPGKKEPIKVEEWDPNAPDPGGVPTPAPTTHFLDANGLPTDQQLLQPGQAGKAALNKILGGYSSTQNKIYAGTVNEYAQSMISGTFDWSKVPPGERIILDGTTIMSGNHRFAAAALAAEATGRPLMGTANAIIPAEGFASEAVIQKTLAAGAYTARPWDGVGVVPGVKAPSPVQTVDDDLRAIRDATNESNAD